MIRDISAKDFDGNSITIHAIKDENFSKYEFLVPNKYKIIYFGDYSGFGLENDASDLLPDLFAKSTEVCIVNLNPKPVPGNDQFWFWNQEKDIELLKTFIAYCDAIKLICRDGSDKINDAIVYFTVDDNIESVVLSEPDTDSVLLQEQY